jgi:hypothetical protein
MNRFKISLVIAFLIPLSCLGGGPPPLPPASTNTVASGPKTNEYTLMEFEVVCSATNCATTNKYRVNLAWVPKPVFELGIEMETSTDLVVWTKTNITHRMVAKDDQRFFRLPRGTTP